MENEIGHKMRCAVKAKLIELGTGGSTGYIDDELPDYVMIMVANKRSRQQMNEDLALFLGTNTQEFVNWLHQVLQKLQEVAVPAVAASLKPKRKLIESNEKKEKKDKRKKIKHSHNKDKDTEEQQQQLQQQQQQQSGSSTSLAGTSMTKTADNTITVPSITDVFADHLIQKARTNLEIEKSIVIKEQNSQQQQQQQQQQDSMEKSMPSDDFDIPTISEIAENAVVTVNRRKEISALADLQRKINQAKRQLKSLGSGESEDEDFINIKDDEEFAVGEDDDSSLLTNKNNKQSSENKINQKSTRIPITYSEKNLKSGDDDDLLTPPFRLSSRLPPPPPPPPPPHLAGAQSAAQKRTSVMDRLGVRGSVGGSSIVGVRDKNINHDSGVDAEPNRPIRENIISLSANRRMEKEIYVPFFRRKDDSSVVNSGHSRNASSSSSSNHHHHDEQQSSSDRSHLKRQRERERERERDRPRDRSSEYEKRTNSTTKDNNSSRNLNTRSNQHRKISPLRDLRERVSESKKASLKRNASTSLSSSSNHRTTNKSGHTPESNNNNNSSSSNNQTSSPPSVSLSKKRLLESRVIVAPPKPEYDENIIEVPVNSIIKVQPRPIVPTNKQASKNLLLRAVAEAQKSTALIKPRKEINEIKKPKQTRSQTAALYSQSYRDKKNRLKTENIVIEIAGGGGGRVSSVNIDDDNGDDGIGVDMEGNFMVKKLINDGNNEDISDVDDENIYISLNTSPENNDDDEEEDDDDDDDDDDDNDNDSKRSYDENDDQKNHTQFVVTLDDDKFSKKLSQRHFDLDEDDLINGFTGGEPLIVKQIKTLKKDRTTNASPLSLALSSTGTELTTNQKVNKLIIKNDTEDEEELRKEVERSTHQASSSNDGRDTSESIAAAAVVVSVAAAAAAPNSSTGNIERPKSTRRNVSPIKFDLSSGKKDDNKISNTTTPTKSNSTKNFDRKDDQKSNNDIENNHRHSNNEKRPKKSSHSLNERNEDSQSAQHHKVTTKHTESYRKYDNLPPLSSTINSAVNSQTDNKSKERCKYYPSCGKGDNCEFTHPPPCKQFPNCKFGDQCLYSHPRCKFDLTCTKHGCNFSHSIAIQSSIGLAPPLSSHVVPVTNYKSITNNSLPAMCKFYPNCTNTLCTFFHPKPCRFGKNCVNKIECNFYHFDMTTPPAKDKLKWVATSPVY